MERRSSIKFAAAGALLAATAAMAKEKPESKAPAKKSGTKPTFVELGQVASKCAQVAQVCAGHCFKLLRTGNTMLAECAQMSLEVSSVSSALGTLAGFESVLTVDQAKVCMASCEQCIKACEPHVGHHQICKECLESCKECLAVCKAFCA